MARSFFATAVSPSATGAPNGRRTRARPTKRALPGITASGAGSRLLSISSATKARHCWISGRGTGSATRTAGPRAPPIRPTVPGASARLTRTARRLTAIPSFRHRLVEAGDRRRAFAAAMRSTPVHPWWCAGPPSRFHADCRPPNGRRSQTRPRALAPRAGGSPAVRLCPGEFEGERRLPARPGAGPCLGPASSPASLASCRSRPARVMKALAHLQSSLIHQTSVRSSSPNDRCSCARFTTRPTDCVISRRRLIKKWLTGSASWAAFPTSRRLWTARLWRPSGESRDLVGPK